MKYLKIIIAIFFLIQVTSCDEILDKDPVSTFSADGFYQTESDCEAAVYGVYDAVQSAFRINFSYWGEGRADNVRTEQSGEALYLSGNNMTVSLSSGDWTNLYTIISRANYAIKNIPDIYDEDDEDGNMLIGQAKALRALAYFYLVRVWGDVPLITDPYTSVDQDIFVSRTDQEDVLDQIEEDLIYASEYCDDKYNSNKDRILITQGGANALLTQVYMWRHEYEKALETSELVLNNSLYSLVTTMANWSDMFINGYSDESIFEVAYDETDQTNGLRTLYAVGSYSIYVPSDVFKASYESGDERIDYVYDVSLAEPKCIWKFLGKGVSDEVSDFYDCNIVLIRLADIMLLRAEALVSVGGSENISEALNLLNQIRERAGLSAFETETEAAGMYGSLESAILHERSIELCYEGHRWFDLVRTGKAISTMNPINGLSDEDNLVWPINSDIINGNPNIEQNEYYK
jgi:hypothetical protein